MRTFQSGDPIIYRKEKVSTHPGPRAREVYPSQGGETYSYLVSKFWLVTDMPDPDHVDVVTRTGKHHSLRVDDPNLRKATMIDRLRYRRRFPTRLD